MNSGASSPSLRPQRRCIIVCQHRSCQRSGAEEVLSAFREAEKPAGSVVVASNCMGQCGSGPTVRVIPDNTWYCRVRPQDVAQIVSEHLEGGKPVQALLHPRFHPQFDAETYGTVVDSPS